MFYCILMVFHDCIQCFFFFLNMGGVRAGISGTEVRDYHAFCFVSRNSSYSLFIRTDTGYVNYVKSVDDTQIV